MSGIPYKIIKNYSRLLHRLWRILKVIWRRGMIAYQWRYAEGVWISKREASKNISKFRTILIFTVQRKIFFISVTLRSFT